jgi:hypothetical protein
MRKPSPENLRILSKLERRIMRRGSQFFRLVRHVGGTPVFLWTPEMGQDRFEVRDRDYVLQFWKTGAGREPTALKFIEQLERTDIPPGSFFMLVLWGGGEGYSWNLFEALQEQPPELGTGSN